VNPKNTSPNVSLVNVAVAHPYFKIKTYVGLPKKPKFRKIQNLS